MSLETAPLGASGAHLDEAVAIEAGINRAENLPLERGHMTEMSPNVDGATVRPIFIFVSLLYVGAAAALALDTFCLAIIFFHPLFFSDAWNAVDHYRLLTIGEYELSYLFSQHNEHRILFPRLIFFLDFSLFYGKNIFNIISIFIIQIFHSLLFCKLIFKLGNKSPFLFAILMSSVFIL
jgi:hypothetical protein